MSEARVQAMLREVVRKAVAGMIARLESDVSPAQTDAYLGHLSSETARIREAQRARDWRVATPFAAEVARQNGLTDAEVEEPAVARQVLALMRQLFELAQHMEEDGANPLHAGRALLLDHGLTPTREALRPPMLLSAAIEKACDEASSDVAKKVRVIGSLALTFYGDIPMTSLDLAKSFDFLHMVWMLPKGWGRSHGRNRHGQAGRDLCPFAETKDADRKNAALVADILAQEDLSVPEKRRRLVTELTPRLVDSYLIVQRDHFNRIVRAALGAKRVGRDIDDADRIVPSHAQLKGRMQKWHNAQKTDCGLPTRVSHPKRRRSWSLEHIARLLNSPVYTGTSSTAQRWRPAKASKRHVSRDALYWVPLFMISLGVRPEEILQLKINNVRRRDGLRP